MREEDLKEIFQEVPEEFHNCIEMTLAKVGEPIIKKRSKKNYRWLALASTLVATTVCATTITYFKWDDFIANRYKVDAVQQEKLIASGNIKQLDIESISNGVTIRPYQVLQDTNSVEIYMEIIAPENITLDEDSLFEEVEVSIDGVENFSSSSGIQKRDRDEKNRAVYVMSLFDIEALQEEIQIDMQLRDLCNYKKLESQTLVEGEWRLSIPVTLPIKMIKNYEVNETFMVGDYPITLRKIGLTSFGYRLEYDLKQVEALEDYYDTLSSDSNGGKSSMSGQLEVKGIRLKDGSVLEHIGGGGSLGPEENSYCIELGFGRAIDIENIESIIIGQNHTEILIK